MPAHSDSTSYHLAVAHRASRDKLDRALNGTGLAVEHWRMLSLLADGTGQSVSALAAGALITISGASKIIDRMASKALVFRRQDNADHRRVLVYASDHGLEALAQADARVSKADADIMSRLTVREKATLRRLLSRLSD